MMSLTFKKTDDNIDTCASFYLELGDKLTAYRIRKKFKDLVARDYFLNETEIDYKISDGVLTFYPISACARYFTWRLLQGNLPELEQELFK